MEEERVRGGVTVGQGRGGCTWAGLLGGGGRLRRPGGGGRCKGGGCPGCAEHTCAPQWKPLEKQSLSQFRGCFGQCSSRPAAVCFQGKFV